MSRFNLRDACAKVAKNDVVQPIILRDENGKGAMSTVAAFKVEGTKAINATTPAQIFAAIKAGGDEYKVNFAAQDVAGTGGKMRKGATMFLMDAEDLITNIKGFLAKDAESEQTPTDKTPHRNGDVKEGAPVVN